VTRDENIRQYEDWIGAKYVEMQPDGSLREVTLSAEDRLERVKQLGQKYVDDIRHALALNADAIQCSCADKEVLAWVQSQFTEDEWKRVNFSFWGVPVPANTKQI
jgi:hypothetical protein